MDAPLVSIVTPTLNQGRFIEATIRSVAKQTYAPIEHIVIDGGSTDGTLDILRRHESDGRLRWISEPDGGMYEAVNKGLALAHGDVLAYLNSDDAYLPWAVEAVVTTLRSAPTIDVVFGDAIRIDQATGDQRLRLFPPFEAPMLARFESLAQPAVFWRRRVFEQIGGFDQDLRYVGDLDYWLRAAGNGGALHLDEVLAIERVHAEALSAASHQAMAEEEARMRSRHGTDPATDVGRRAIADAARRHKLWQRRLWLRFLAAKARGGAGGRGRGGRGPWLRIRAEGGLRVSLPRALIGQLPRVGDRYLTNAVRSRLAAEILRGD